ncbi:uncharacterized protein LOC111261244 [Varroa jacobsoni]|uniref:uncharacterized protein LOC111261244 n=1 Tax=Varroa jacobsoni TaxID=62625 RepID=UPI000BF5FAF0|nr:uncharacterized protein LOC111261244 [Varroa jacobsoni]
MQAIDEPVFRFQDKPCHSNALCGVHGHLDHSTLKAVTVGSGVYFSQRSRNLKAAVPLPRKTIRQRRFSTSRKIPVQQAIHNNISILVTSWSASNPQDIQNLRTDVPWCFKIIALVILSAEKSLGKGYTVLVLCSCGICIFSQSSPLFARNIQNSIIPCSKSQNTQLGNRSFSSGKYVASWKYLCHFQFAMQIPVQRLSINGICPGSTKSSVTAAYKQASTSRLAFRTTVAARFS